jgi:hypothetical protein
VICVLLSLAFSPPLKKFSSSLLLIQKMPATQKPVLHTLPLYCIYYPYTAYITPIMHILPLYCSLM